MRLALFLLTGLTACTTAAPPPGEPSVLVFQPRLGHGAPSPFPCDAAVDEAGIPPHDDLVSRSARRPDGFAPWSPIWMRFRGPAVDVSALPREFRNDATAPIVIHVSPPGAPAPGAAALADPGALAPYRIVYDEATNTLALLLRGGVPERSRVTVLVRSSLKNVVGGAIALDTGFDAYLATLPALPAGALAAFSYQTAAVQTVYAAFAAAVTPIAEVAPAPFDVYAPALLETGSPVTALAERLPEFYDEFAPTVTGVGAVVYGTLDLGSVRGPEGALALTSVTTAAAVREKVEFMAVIPAPAAMSAEARARAGNPPRYRAVIFGHGYTACKETLLGLAAAFAREGLALLAIDAVGHGARAGGDGQCGARLPSDFGTDPGAVEAGFADTIVQTRQLVGLLPAIAARIDVSPADGAPDLDVAAVGYIGQSMGAINGPAVVSQEPRLTAGVFNVGLGGLAAAMFSRGSAAEKVPGAAFLPFDNLGVVTSFTLADQLYEPLHFTAGLAGKAVLVQQAEFDELVPPLGTEWFALALGAVQEQGAPRAIAGLAAAAFPPPGTAPAYRSVYAEADHIFLISPPGAAPGVMQAAQRQAAGFLASALFDEAPVAPASR